MSHYRGLASKETPIKSKDYTKVFQISLSIPYGYIIHKKIIIKERLYILNFNKQ